MATSKYLQAARFAFGLAKEVIRRRARYMSLLPPFARRQYVLDRRRNRVLAFEIRDDSDYMSLHQVYLTEGYDLSWMPRWTEVVDRHDTALAAGTTPLIVDCGANIGLSARYFADLFPRAHVVGIEPNASNLALAIRNCGRSNVEFVRAGISAEDGSAALEDPGLGHNAYRLRQSTAGETPLVSMSTLVEQQRALGRMPLIAKIDIEGFEAQLFASNTLWIDEFPLLIVELHDWMLPGSANSNAFLRAMAARNRDFLLHGEHVLSIRNEVSAPAP